MFLPKFLTPGLALSSLIPELREILLASLSNSLKLITAFNPLQLLILIRNIYKNDRCCFTEQLWDA